MLISLIRIVIGTLLATSSAQAAYNSHGPNVFYYWGQNSVHGGNTQEKLSTYCKSGKMDAVLLSFLHVFDFGGLPGLNFANTCNTYFQGSLLLNCPDIEEDIKICQSLGIKVLLSLGGAVGSYGFSSDSQARDFADTVWDLFGGGSSSIRPFGDTEIDGIDLDIEGGSSTGYVAFVKAIRSKFPSDFIVGAAPQCPFPDVILGPALDKVEFDYVNVQFYNNYCSAAGNSFNYDSWANWARHTSPNKNVKVFFTTPGSTTAATSGYVPIETIKEIVPALASTYTDVFGGVSVWDASQAWANGRFATELYPLVHHHYDTKSSKSPSKWTTSNNSIKSKTSTKIACVNSNQKCSNEGQHACSSHGAYAMCTNKKWVVSSCPASTTCMPTTDGASVYCGYVNAGSSITCPTLNARDKIYDVLDLGNTIPKTYTSSQVSTQFTVIKTSFNEFEAVINARRTDYQPFNDSISIQFKAPDNVRFNQVSHGTIRQYGNSVQIKHSVDKRMAMVIKIKGTVTSSDAFVAPNPSSFRIK